MILPADLVLASGTDLYVTGILRASSGPLFAGRPRRFHHCSRSECCFRGPWLDTPVATVWELPAHLLSLSEPGDRFWVGVFTPAEGRQLVSYEQVEGVPFDAARELFEADGGAGFLALDEGRPVELLVQETRLTPAENWTMVGFYDRDDLLEDGGIPLT